MTELSKLKKSSTYFVLEKFLTLKNTDQQKAKEYRKMCQQQQLQNSRTISHASMQHFLQSS